MYSLLAAEIRVTDEASLVVWLEALGNAGTADVFAAVARYTADPRVHIREVAVGALRKHRSAVARALLTERAAGDPSPEVRRRATDVLAKIGSF